MLLERHESAFEYDLMCMTGRTIPEVMALPQGVVSLAHFAAHLPQDSATICEESGYDGVHEWSTTYKTNVLLADVYDELQGLSWMFARSRKGKPRKPKPYPRPWAKTARRVIGAGAVPVRKFKDWWKDKDGRRS